MKDVQELCERVIIIDHGKILYDGKLDDIIRSHTTHKTLSFTLKHKIDPKKFAKLGEVKQYEFPKVLLSVPIAESNRIAARLLEDYPVVDLNIEEPDIEEIIRDFFMRPKA